MASFPPDLTDPSRTEATSSMRDLYAIKIKSIWATVKHEPLSFWAINLYLLFEYVRPQTSYPSIDILPWDKVVLVIALITLLGEQRTVEVRNGADKLMGLFLIAVLVSSAFATYSGLSFSHLSEFVDWLVIYFLITRIIVTERRFFIFYLAFLIYNFKMSLHGFRSWAGRGFAWENWGVTGAPGWFQNSGEFGIELCIFFPLCYYFIAALWQNWGRVKRLFFLAFPFTAVASIAATSSRGAALGIAGAVVFMTMQSRHRIKAIAFAAAVLAALYFLIPPQSLARFYTAGTDKTSVERLVRWKDGLNMLSNHPFFGIGYFNWDKYYSSHYSTVTGHYGLPHNIFIQAGAELGFFGLGAFIMLIVATFVNNYRTRKLAPKTESTFLYNTALGLDAAMIGFLVSGSFITVLYYPYFWIDLSLVVALRTVAKQAAQHAPAPLWYAAPEFIDPVPPEF